MAIEFRHLMTLLSTTIAYEHDTFYVAPEIPLQPYVVSHSYPIPLGFSNHVDETMAAKAFVLNSESVEGQVKFYQPHDRSPVFIVGNLKGLRAGAYSLFITKFGSMADACTKTGPIWGMHFAGQDYGWPRANKPAGDLGRVHADNDSVADFHYSNDRISLVPGHPTNILGRGLVVTAAGNGSYAKTPSTIACGPIFAEQPRK
ncbi:uncharacterized protein LOC126843476 [Adelges cooleyi]|uniref:uncharacterized protein LOC126843476 n=1 Tax=Adelges cooleyi TaxID=133065 RepID=UPI00218022F3|nr:uncharacterized protein LOC126843476 [Adelges cooleyi]